MAKISKKRQAVISQDADTIRMIYDQACIRWGKEKVHKDLTRIWNMRCMLGMQNVVPFRSMNSQNLGEVLWVVENVLGIKREPK